MVGIDSNAGGGRPTFSYCVDFMHASGIIAVQNQYAVCIRLTPVVVPSVVFIRRPVDGSRDGFTRRGRTSPPPPIFRLFAVVVAVARASQDMIGTSFSARKLPSAAVTFEPVASIMNEQPRSFRRTLRHQERDMGN